MGAPSPYPPDPNVTEIEMELRRRPHGLSDGQIAFDLLFGVVCPVLLFWTDPAIFYPSVAPTGSLPAYWAGPTYAVAGILAFGLLVWVIAGPRHGRLGMLLAGPFALGAALWLVLAVGVLPSAFAYAGLLGGMLAFTPMFTSLVYAVNCVRAARAGSERSGLLTGFLFLGGFAAPLVAILVVFGARDRQAKLLEIQFLSSNAADHMHAVEAIRSGVGVDFDRIAQGYESLDPTSPAGKRVREQFLTLNSMPIDEVLKRLHHDDFAPPDEQEPVKKPEAETADQQVRRLTDDLFDASDAVAEKAMKALIGNHDFDREEVVRGYLKLAETDPRRERVAKAYGSLTGDDIHLAIERRKRDARSPVQPMTPTPIDPPEPLEPGP